ncbi:TetR/AcrR family transcriptional regulator [Herbiconiux sp. P15]|uniref:TetR/AcrR family transcriptional regulator n=1 Tax=Herbiconiux liukaitaii TaxID=3342799 RepID=UPI0035BA1AA4
MDRKALILAAARQLTLERGVVPSLNETASVAGVSKGGLLHHFPSRAALVQGLAAAALEEIDAAMVAASGEGRAAETWLRISVPAGEDVALFQALAIAYRAVETPVGDVVTASREAIVRWEAMIEAETGDATRARIIRLVGDGLATNVVAGLEAAPSEAELDALIDALIRRPTKDAR